MDSHTTDGGPTRRSLLQRGVLLSASLGIGLSAMTGSAAADKAELVEAIATESGLSKADAKRALDSCVGLLTDDLVTEGAVCIERFGCHVVNTGPSVGRYQDGDDLYLRKRPGRGRGHGKQGNDSLVRKRPGRTVRSNITENDVGFRCSPELAATLGLRVHPLSGVPEGVPVLSAVRLARAAKLSGKTCEAFLEAFVRVATKALKEGEPLSLAGFGTYSISKRSARTGRNPQTGKEIQIAAKNEVKFKAGAELSKAVN